MTSTSSSVTWAASATDNKCWRLDSLADAARSKEWQAAAAAAQRAAEEQQVDGVERDNSTKQTRKPGRMFGSFKAFVSDWMPFGLSSTLKSTKSNLQRLMTSQIAAMPDELPEGEGYDTLQDNIAGFKTIQEEQSTPRGVDAAAATAHNADLMAAADAALAEAAADTGAREMAASLDRVASVSVFAAGVPTTLRAVSEESLGLPVSRRSSVLSCRSMRSTGLPRASTLKMMESSHAWLDLHAMEVQQACADTSAGSSPALTPQVSSNAAQAQAKGSSGKAKVQRQLHDRQKDSLLAPASFVKALAGLSVSIWSSTVASQLSSMLAVQSSGPVFSNSIKKQSHTTLSTDGWTLHLVHCFDTSIAAEQCRHHPILMCPGLASSGPSTFDLLPHVSLVDFLASEGWDVWVVDIRGNGLADKISRIDIESEWLIDDYLVQDVPACIDYVLKHSPCKADKLHWIGHSMGGMLGSGLCSQAGKWGKRLRSVTLVGSGCFGDGSWHVLLKKLVVPITSFGFPAHITTQGLALLADTPVALSVFETLFYWPTNMERATRKALLATCFNFIPAKLVAQFLDSHGSVSGLTNCRGTFLYADPDVLGMCKVPVLGLSGDWDLFCPAAGGARNVELFGGPKQHLTFGPEHGQKAHYGHFDVVVGRNAQQEVWPHLGQFLAQHDAPAGLRQLWDSRLLREDEV